jgi:hypothetical protein
MRTQYITLFIFTLLNTVAAAIEWEKVSPYPTSSDLLTAAHGNGVSVAGGKNIILYSKDAGATWKDATGVTTETVREIRFGNGFFLAIADTNRVLISTNGSIWTSQTIPVSSLQTLTFGNGLFVAGSDAGAILTSRDGMSWQGFYFVSTAPLQFATYGGGIYFLKEIPSANSVSGPQMFVITSTDGVSWRRSAMNGIPSQICPPFDACSTDIQVTGMTYAAGLNYFVTRVLWTGSLIKQFAYYTSTNGVDWASNPGASPPANPYQFLYGFPPGNDLRFENGQFIQIAAYDIPSNPPLRIYTSADLNNWVAHDLPTVSDHFAPYGIAMVGANYLLTGTSGTVFYGPSLDALTRIDNTEKSIELVSVAAKGNTIVGVANLRHAPATGFVAGAIVLSTNAAKTFQKIPFPGPAWYLASIRYFDGTFTAVGSHGAIFQSQDGFNWWALPGIPSVLLFDVAAGNGKSIVVGESGTILTSTNGTQFTAQNSGTDVDLYGVASGNRAFVAVGDSGAILRSSEAENWSLSGTVEGTALWSVAFGNDEFVAVGDGGRVYVSADGISWTGNRIIGAASLCRIAFAHGLFVAVDFATEKTYSSEDGAHWMLTKIPGMSMRGADVSDGVLWVTGASANAFESSISDFGTFIYREKTATSLSLTGLIQSGHFHLNFNAPTIANYRIYSSPGPDAALWNSRVVVTNINGEVSWEDPDSLQTQRFYRVDQE